MKLSNRRRFYLLISLAVFMVLAIGWFDYMVLLGTIAKRSKMVSEVRKDIMVSQTQLRDLPMLQQQKIQLRQEQAPLDAFSPFADGLTFINTFERIATNSKVTVHFDVQNDAKPLFRVQASGSFNAIVVFLEQLSVIPVETDLTQIIKIQEPKGTNFTLQADMSLRPSLALKPSSANPPTNAQ